MNNFCVKVRAGYVICTSNYGKSVNLTSAGNPDVEIPRIPHQMVWILRPAMLKSKE